MPRRSLPPLVQSLVLSLALALVALPSGAATRRMFVTSGTCKGDLGACSAESGDDGVAAANNICQDAAALAGLTAGGEQFVAWLSDAATDAYCNALGLSGKRGDVPPCGQDPLPAAGPWIRIDGVPFAMSIDDLVGAGPLSPAQVQETGASFAFLNDFETGSKADGTLSAEDCSHWSDATSGSNWAGGTTDATESSFASGASSGCNGDVHLLCFELGAGDAVSLPHAAGALAFVSSATGTGDLSIWDGSGGVDGRTGGDAVCRHLATLADLPSPDAFVAWLSDASGDAKLALGIDGPWRRLDGIPIADSLADLTDYSLRSSLSIDETGARSILLPWTGTNGAGLALTDHCSSWSDGTSGSQGEVGRAPRASGTWTQGFPTDCSSAHPIYCFGTVVVLGWDNFESGDFVRWSAVQN
jgi:hypothetical protein